METVCKATLERTLPPDMQEDAIHNKAYSVCVSTALCERARLQRSRGSKEVERNERRYVGTDRGGARNKRRELCRQAVQQRKDRGAWRRRRRRRAEGHHSRQRRQQRQRRLVTDIRDLALPPDPASQPPATLNSLNQDGYSPCTH